MSYETDGPDDTYLVPGLERGLRILTGFSHKEPLQGAPEIARRLGIPRTTVFRLLQTLEQMGFVERAKREASFQLGVGPLQLGNGYLKSLPVIRHGMPLIERLRDHIGQTVHLVIRDGTDIVYAARAEKSMSRLGSIKVNVGARLPAHATVHGQVLLGGLNFDDLMKLYGKLELPRLSPRTPSTVSELYERILITSQQGYGVSESYFEAGVSAVSAPVRCKDGHIVAVVAITVGRSNFDGDFDKNKLINESICTANEVSRALIGEWIPRITKHNREGLLSATS